MLLVVAGCGNRSKAVSGTIEVDEAHVGAHGWTCSENFPLGEAIICVKAS
jgi:hypothetical protein